MTWDKVPFETLYAIPSRNGLTRPARVRGEGYKMINMGELFGHDRIASITMERVQLNERELEEMCVETGDLLFARQSLVLSGAGKCSVVVDASEPTTFESHIIRVRLKKEKANPLFYFYYFKSPSCGIKSIVTQGVQAGIRGNELKTLSVHVPPIDTQGKIVNLLVAYDELIENNRRRIELLEESVKLLYQEWFIHLRFPGSERVRVKSGAPDGWSSRPLGMYFDVKHGYAFKGEYFSDEETKRVLLTPGNFKVGGGLKLSKIKYYADDAPLDEDYVLKQGDVLLTMTDLSKTGDTLGFPLLVPSMNKISFLHNQRLGKVLFKGDGYIPKYYFYYLFQDYRYRAYIVGSATGTSVKHTAPNRIASYSHLMPDSMDCEIVREFDSFAESNQTQIEKLTNQIQLLESARELLLPRLMAGEIAA